MLHNYVKVKFIAVQIAVSNVVFIKRSEKRDHRDKSEYDGDMTKGSNKIGSGQVIGGVAPSKTGPKRKKFRDVIHFYWNSEFSE